MKPTYLYIKQHRVTGLKYFGKTIRADPQRYRGSGAEWKNHLAIHGNDVDTTWYQLFTDENEMVRFAENFCSENNIVESPDWANRMVETGRGTYSKEPYVPHPERVAKLLQALAPPKRREFSLFSR